MDPFQTRNRLSRSPVAQMSNLIRSSSVNMFKYVEGLQHLPLSSPIATHTRRKTLTQSLYKNHETFGQKSEEKEVGTDKKDADLAAEISRKIDRVIVEDKESSEEQESGTSSEEETEYQNKQTITPRKTVSAPTEKSKDYSSSSCLDCSTLMAALEKNREALEKANALIEQFTTEQKNTKEDRDKFLATLKKYDDKFDNISKDVEGLKEANKDTNKQIVALQSVDNDLEKKVDDMAKQLRDEMKNISSGPPADLTDVNKKIDELKKDMDPAAQEIKNMVKSQALDQRSRLELIVDDNDFDFTGKDAEDRKKKAYDYFHHYDKEILPYEISACFYLQRGQDKKRAVVICFSEHVRNRIRLAVISADTQGYLKVKRGQTRSQRMMGRKKAVKWQEARKKNIELVQNWPKTNPGKKIDKLWGVAVKEGEVVLQEYAIGHPILGRSKKELYQLTPEIYGLV